MTMSAMDSQAQGETPDIPQPEWTERVCLRTVDAEGGIRDVVIQLGEPCTAVVELLDDQSRTVFGGTDYRDCLTQVRRQLEHEGRLLCCQGARPNVHASGQLFQFSNGLEAYVFPPDIRKQVSEVVDIFAAASPADVVSLADQRTAFMRYWDEVRRSRKSSQTSTTDRV